MFKTMNNDSQRESNKEVSECLHVFKSQTVQTYRNSVAVGERRGALSGEGDRSRDTGLLKLPNILLVQVCVTCNESCFSVT